MLLRPENFLPQGLIEIGCKVDFRKDHKASKRVEEDRNTWNRIFIIDGVTVQNPIVNAEEPFIVLLSW